MSDDKRIAALLSQTLPVRYEHFIKQVVAFEEVWGLYNDGWAMATTNDGKPVFPVWPKKEFAELCATEIWANYQPRAIPIDEFIEVVLPELKSEGSGVGIFYTPQGQGALPSIEQVLDDLSTELARYE